MTTFSETVLCQCGCGLPAPLASYQTRTADVPRGMPLRFRQGHHNNLKAKSWPDRFWAKVDKTGQGHVFEGTPCWLWTGGKTDGGYGLWHRRENRKVITLLPHRVSYELVVGPIPEGYTIDHKCRLLTCVNPAHLEPVPHSVNLLRGNTVNAANAAKTHCKHGHEFTPDNTYIHPSAGTRSCRKCRCKATSRYRSGRARR
jgi:hypothetical protein